MNHQRTAESSNAIQSPIQTTSRTTTKEQDLILFGDESIGTMIKKHGALQFNNYQDLTKKQKYTMGLCLNSILNLADDTEDGQKQLFSPNEWSSLKAKLMKTKSIHLCSNENISSI
ncbi:unnamed protein product [Absidia cylindrospora]